MSKKKKVAAEQRRPLTAEPSPVPPKTDLKWHMSLPREKHMKETDFIPSNSF